MYDFRFETVTEGYSIEYRVEEICPEIADLHFDIKYDKQIVPDRFEIKWSVPAIEFYSVWTPLEGTNRSLGKDWSMISATSRLAVGAPVLACVDASGDNKITIGLSDPKTPADIGCGVVEETGDITFRVSFFIYPSSPISEYKATIRLDTRKMPFTETVMSIGEWWENDLGYKHAYVPEYARLPMNSAWYSFHQELESEKILRECELSSKVGLKTIILDDGWQTDDNNRGYGYCGDWELATSKIPDMAKLVDDIHKLGMKVMLWYSVPFVGIYSKVYDRFKDKALCGTDLKAIVLDPRYPEVRQYLTDVYKKALIDWKLDGFKLDFIDSFRYSKESKPFGDGMDIYSVEDAVDTLLNEIYTTLKEINPEILIEFRQAYMGPSVLKYGNMVRVGDCAYDALANRRGSIDLRLTSGNSAVHSDMLMWGPQESAEGVCIQLFSAFFAVPQISVLFEKIPEEHKKLLAFWMDFYTKHRETLMGKLSVKNTEICYTQVTAKKEREAITINYVPLCLSLENCDTHYFINSTFEDFVAVKAEGKFSASVYSCMGEKINELTVKEPITSIPVPACGMVEFKAL